MYANLSLLTDHVLQKFLFTKKRGWISHEIKKKKWPRTQDLEIVYIINSAAFITKRTIYEKKKNRLNNKPLPIISRSFSSYVIETL